MSRITLLGYHRITEKRVLAGGKIRVTLSVYGYEHDSIVSYRIGIARELGLALVDLANEASEKMRAQRQRRKERCST